MSSKGIDITILIYILVYITMFTQNIKCYDNNDDNNNNKIYLNFTEITKLNGYDSEEHTVKTEDGYLLTLFRMKKGIKCKEELITPPVLLEHGLLLSSDVWLDAGTEQGLAYLLADDCFDLWLGNQRGNYYARKHVTFDPYRGSDFWKFSNDEIGYYDIPATIDYVLKATNSSKLNYIGFSQGCGSFYIMCSERPEYNDKVNLKISLAPATRHLNTKAPGFRKITTAFKILKPIFDISGYYEAFARGGTTQTMFKALCENPFAYEICSIAESFFDGFNPGSITPETIQRMVKNFPAGTSTQNLAKYGQAMVSEEFKKYDFGFAENMKVYKVSKPPVYDLTNVRVPTVVIYGINDGIVDKDDVKWVISQLPNVAKVYEIEDPNWTHFDFTFSNFTTKYLYRKIKKFLNIYSAKYDDALETNTDTPFILQ